MSEAQQTGALSFKSLDGRESGITYVKAGDLAANQVAGQGIFLGMVENPRTKKKDVKLSETDDAGNETGRTIIINGAGNLEYRMKKAVVGSLIRVVYEGKTPLQSGPFKGTLAHNFDVQGAE